MKKLGKILLMILSYVLVAAIAVALTLFVGMKGGSYSKLEQLEALLLQCYINGADKTKLEDAAAHAMVDALGDRWSYYIPADEYAAYQEQKKNAYVGIGVTIRYTENGYHIDAVTEGGPAEKAGLLPGDVMIAVDGKSVIGMPVEDGKTLVQGKKGTTVEITVDRAGEQLTITVKRDTIRTKVAEGEMLPGNIGLVTIKNFNTNCYKESREAVEQLMEQGAVAIIFDVRYNGGGYAEEMVKLLDYLLPKGDLFRTVDFMGVEDVDKSDAACVELPMAVLVNGSSYSAAEFFAAALREYEWATVVGEKTSGKGHFQVTYPLSDGSAVGLSIGKYFTPKGQCLEGVGLVPDVPVAVDEETAYAIYAGTLDPMEDPQILAAIEALKQSD
jgi:carboxyl-terminal processing protease